MALLFPVYAAAFFGGIWLFFRYALYGTEGSDFLRLRAEESGDYKKMRRVRFLFIAVLLVSAAVVCFLLVCGVIVSSASGGKKGMIANFSREPVSFVLLAAFVVLFLAATVMRLRIRHLMKDAEKQGPAPLSPDAVFRVSYVKNPRRINNLMNGVVFLVFLAWIPIGLIVSPYASTAFGVLIGVFLLLILAWLIGEVILEHRQVCELLVMDRKGILDKNPDDSVGFIPWRDVENVSVSYEKITLTLNRTVPDHPERNEVACIRLDRSPVSCDTIYRKIKQYRLLARQAEQQELPPDPEKEAAT